MRITDIVWKERVVRKLGEKHGVSTAEAEEVLLSGPLVRKMAKGHVQGEDVYAALAQIDSGRRLIVFFINKKHGLALPISARDMSLSERRYYERHR
ncbi:MAG: BrnT family toxin [Planctomycetes bacterium]|nr:BrnT family toxin [Planctomycetota bacterium]